MKKKENFTINIAQEFCERACITDVKNSYITPIQQISATKSFLKSNLAILNQLSNKNQLNNHQLVNNTKNEAHMQYLSTKNEEVVLRYGLEFHLLQS